ncbi:MAG: hypothetical protein GWN61_17390 [candidate division Zixibacteria bacterium]|nr:hypothetical protein [candidate division Zixibacteria bacterium]NIS47648.1 hypothetical protein [candidate division Zixibacteria bacterium]NIU15744.1 hypothetical protein [candidate division Zixibacteria bacterium]NIV07896.1 hypothetical protein [candidate division Zixibacteria bacterium]NIW47188.1 hypothetical protein [Gammaproteobacteria bacterium]
MKRIFFWIVVLVCLSVIGIACSGFQALFSNDKVETGPHILITDYIRRQLKDPPEEINLTLEEIPLEEPEIQLPVRIFQVKQGLFADETFLIHDDSVYQLGTAYGGNGVSSMLITDLDQDGAPELTYTYSFGSGIHQSRVGIFAPAYEAVKLQEADFAYQGDIGLLSDQDVVEIRVLKVKPDLQILDYKERIGTLYLREVSGQVDLVVEITPGLPEQISERIINTSSDTGNE